MNRKFLLCTAGLTLVALLIRLHYVLTVELVNPLGGDAREYVAYAENILRGYFGIGSEPDAYRSPGYPTLLAQAIFMGGNWVLRVQVWQAIMGAGTVALTACLGRRFLPPWAALAAAGLLAVWPHHIAFTAEILGEVTFGLTLSAAMLVSVVAIDRKDWRWAVAAGVAWAIAYLVNPICAALPFALAVVWWRPAIRTSLAMLAPFILIALLWSLRPADGGSERIWTNLVQGSYPLYHRAYVSRNAHPEPARIIATIDADVREAIQSPSDGLNKLADRMAAQPGDFANWYTRKAFLLWDWDVRISDAFGPYVHKANGSPLDAGLGRFVIVASKAINPVLFWLALVGLFAAWRSGVTGRAVALSFLYFTAAHMVLQAEPRYSVPYRSLESLLTAAALAWLLFLRPYTKSARGGKAPVGRQN
ncbi:glycosyltransferase family 39 protein [Pseudoxanthomonas sp. PXM05]|uniref:glycosyltransferase family 39 protein n=1 Tax=Pseudoxanthomonas sp. PXM05 TaxID=2854775 RepID=UPI001C48B03B|nr:glycosyltransferase family 39 protein [Pseudoxanthomonas sp. PXM05]MBV7475406.1 glycosyltransferase family 39 protein [Pseudoxanthomonas sp. PXM05]